MLIKKISAIGLLALGLSGCNSTPQTPLVELAIKYRDMQAVQEAHAKQLAELQPFVDRIKDIENDVTQIADLAEQSPAQFAALESIENMPFAAEESTVNDAIVIEQPSIAALPSLSIVESAVEEDRTLQAIEVIDNKADVIASSPKTQRQIEPTPVRVPEVAMASAVSREVTSNVRPDLGRDMGTDNAPLAQITTSTTTPTQSSQRIFDDRLFAQCAPQVTQASASNFGVHVVSFRDKQMIPKGWNELVAKHPAFCQRGAVIKEVNVNDKTFYSLRVGPYTSKDDAKTACDLVRKNKQYCRVTNFAGDVL